ncbi:polysaccharide biosynthesis protein, partial [Bacillus sp. JJ1127]
CILGAGIYEISTIVNVTTSRLVALLFSTLAIGVVSLLYVICALKLRWITKEQIPFWRK